MLTAGPIEKVTAPVICRSCESKATLLDDSLNWPRKHSLWLAMKISFPDERKLAAVHGPIFNIPSGSAQLLIAVGTPVT
jgi:hypothetical protein